MITNLSTLNMNRNNILKTQYERIKLESTRTAIPLQTVNSSPIMAEGWLGHLS